MSVTAIVAKNAKGAYQLIIRRMDAAEGCRMADYVNGLSEEMSAHFSGLLWEYINSIEDEDYSALTRSVYEGIPNLEDFPATLREHHSFGGGFLVYTVCVTSVAASMLRALDDCNANPEYRLPYDKGLATAAALLHAVGTVRMITPCPDMRRVPESVPLGPYELTAQCIREAARQKRNLKIKTERLNLLLHTIGCAYEGAERKPMLREAVVLKEAANLVGHVSFLERFMHANRGKEGMVFDEQLGNYIYLQKE